MTAAGWQYLERACERPEQWPHHMHKCLESVKDWKRSLALQLFVTARCYEKEKRFALAVELLKALLPFCDLVYSAISTQWHGTAFQGGEGASVLCRLVIDLQKAGSSKEEINQAIRSVFVQKTPSELLPGLDTSLLRGLEREHLMSRLPATMMNEAVKIKATRRPKEDCKSCRKRWESWESSFQLQHEPIMPEEVAEKRLQSRGYWVMSPGSHGGVFNRIRRALCSELGPELGAVDANESCAGYRESLQRYRQHTDAFEICFRAIEACKPEEVRQALATFAKNDEELRITQLVALALGGQTLAAICRYMIRECLWNGQPDLLALRAKKDGRFLPAAEFEHLTAANSDDCQFSIQFVEVKTTDKLRPNQRSWFALFREQQIPCEIYHVVHDAAGPGPGAGGGLCHTLARVKGAAGNAMQAAKKKRKRGSCEDTGVQ
jgi:hypothetical protein